MRRPALSRFIQSLSSQTLPGGPGGPGGNLPLFAFLGSHSHDLGTYLIVVRHEPPGNSLGTNCQRSGLGLLTQGDDGTFVYLVFLGAIEHSRVCHYRRVHIDVPVPSVCPRQNQIISIWIACREDPICPISRYWNQDGLGICNPTHRRNLSVEGPTIFLRTCNAAMSFNDAADRQYR